MDAMVTIIFYQVCKQFLWPMDHDFELALKFLFCKISICIICLRDYWMSKSWSQIFISMESIDVKFRRKCWRISEIDWFFWSCISTSSIHLVLIETVLEFASNISKVHQFNSLIFPTVQWNWVTSNHQTHFCWTRQSFIYFVATKQKQKQSATKLINILFFIRKQWNYAAQFDLIIFFCTGFSIFLSFSSWMQISFCVLWSVYLL